MLPRIHSQAAAFERPVRMGAAYVCMIAGMVLCFFPSTHHDEERQLQGMLRALGMLLLGFLLHPGSRGQANVPAGQQCSLVVGMVRDARGNSWQERALCVGHLLLNAGRIVVLGLQDGRGKQSLIFNTLGGIYGLLPFAVDRAWGRSRITAEQRLESLFPSLPARYRHAHLYDTSTYGINSLCGGALLQLAGIMLQGQLGLLIWRATGSLPPENEHDWRRFYPMLDLASALPGLAADVFSTLTLGKQSCIGSTCVMLAHAGGLPLRYLRRTSPPLMGILCAFDIAGLVLTRRLWRNSEARYPVGFEIAPIRLHAEPPVQMPRARTNPLALTIHPAPMPELSALGYYDRRPLGNMPDSPSRSASRLSFVEDPPPSPPRDAKLRALPAELEADDEYIRYRQRLAYFGKVRFEGLEHWLNDPPEWQYPPPPFPKPQQYLDYPWHPGAAVAEHEAIHIHLPPGMPPGIHQGMPSRPRSRL